MILLLVAMILGSNNSHMGFYFDTITSNNGLLKEYENLAKKNNKDIIVTLDLPFYAFGQLLDESIYEIEDEIIYNRLVKLLKDIRLHLKKYKNTKCIPAKEGALLVDAYIKIPLYFLTQDKSLLDKEELIKEVNLIKTAKGIVESPVFKYKEDYSQYRPRSHYTKNERMKNYFRAMMYLGRMGFYPFIDGNISSNNIRGALILSQIIEENPEIKKEYLEISRIIDLIVGKSDDLLPTDFSKILKMYNVLPQKALCSESYDKRIKEGLSAYKRPTIFSQIVSDEDTPSLKLISIKLFGQRWVFDSYVFQNLVYTKVGTKQKPRLLPSGLDIQSVLGSERALDILIDTYKEDRFKNYLIQMEFLQKLTEKYGDSIFGLSLYHNFLGIEQKYIKAKKESPIFLYNENDYATKKIITNLAAWALLKHATLLYGKQSYTVGITSVPPKTMKYGLCLVEPYSQIIFEMVALSKRLHKLTKGLKVNHNIKELSKLLGLMLTVSLTEKSGIPNQKDMDNLRFFLKYNTLLDMDGKSLDLPCKIADVHSDPNTQKVLEVGTGFPIKIIYELNNGKKVVGFIMSYYEFQQDINHRLTDSEWNELLKESKINMPQWVIKFIKNRRIK